MRPLAKSKSRFFLLHLLRVRPRSPHSGVLHWVSITILPSWVWRFLKKRQRGTLLTAGSGAAASRSQDEANSTAAPQSPGRSLFMLPAEAAKRRGGSLLLLLLEEQRRWKTCSDSSRIPTAREARCFGSDVVLCCSQVVLLLCRGFFSNATVIEAFRRKNGNVTGRVLDSFSGGETSEQRHELSSNGDF